MQRFIHNENLKRFHELLAQENDPAKREQLERLITADDTRVHEPPPATNSKH